jgi:hypothetical protein
MSDVFVSYARKDAPIVDQLVGALVAAGIEPWIDRHKVPAGTKWFLEVPKALEDAPCVLGCWTENAPISEHVREECDLAKEKNKLIPVACRMSGPHLVSVVSRLMTSLPASSMQAPRPNLTGSSMISRRGGGPRSESCRTGPALRSERRTRRILTR